MRKNRDSVGDRFWIGAGHEPQAAPQPLIKGSQSVGSQPTGSRRSVRISDPMKVAFMKAIAVENQPTQYRIETREALLKAQRQASHRPADPHVSHVNMWLARAVQKC